MLDNLTHRLPSAALVETSTSSLCPSARWHRCAAPPSSCSREGGSPSSAWQRLRWRPSRHGRRSRRQLGTLLPATRAQSTDTAPSSLVPLSVILRALWRWGALGAPGTAAGAAAGTATRDGVSGASAARDARRCRQTEWGARVQTWEDHRRSCGPVRGASSVFSTARNSPEDQESRRSVLVWGVS